VIKSRGAKGKANVTFTVDPQVGAQTAAVCGEWNDWSADADVMHRDADGGFSATVNLDSGRAYRFRYLLDGHRWDNDWSADAYQPNGFGGDDSVVDLTALAEAVPAAPKKTPAKKTPAKKTPAKREASKKTPEAKNETTPKKASATKVPAPKAAPKKAPAAKDKAAPDQAAALPAKPAQKQGR
jgi:hypothetical protein